MQTENFKRVIISGLQAFDHIRSTKEDDNRGWLIVDIDPENQRFLLLQLGTDRLGKWVEAWKIQQSVSAGLLEKFIPKVR